VAPQPIEARPRADEAEPASGEDLRARARVLRAGLTSGAAAGARVVSMAVAFVTVPLTLDYLGSDRYGMWMTISSFALMLGFADLGIGNGLLNLVGEANGTDDRKAAREAVSSAAAMLSVIGLVVLAVLAVSYWAVPWEDVFNVTAPAAVSEAGPAIAVFTVLLALNIPLGLVQRVQLGYQRGYMTYLWQAVGSLCSLAGALLVIEVQGGLPWLVLALAGGPVIAVILNWVQEFGRTHRWLLPSRRWVRAPVAKRLLRLGAMFFVLQLTMTIGYATDNIVVAQVLGSAEVTQFAVPARLFGFIALAIALVAGPLWPAYSEAFARGDARWVRRTVERSTLLAAVVSGVMAAVLVLYGDELLQLWVGDAVQPSASLLLGLGAWAVLGSVGMCVGMFWNGTGILRFQVICAVFMSVAALGLKIVLAQRWGVAGVAWGVVIAYSVFVALPTVVYLPIVLRRLVTAPAAVADESAPAPTADEWSPGGDL
jgi:O-antigen/teichoic acid export membrane protein